MTSSNPEATTPNPYDEEGTITLRFVIGKPHEAEPASIYRIERTSVILPPHITSEDINEIIADFWEYPSELINTLAGAFQHIPEIMERDEIV